MTLGLLNYATCSIATTGILGPTGGSKEKPVGLVYIGLGFKDKIKVIKHISNKTTRYDIKVDIVEVALNEFLNFLKSEV